MPDFKRGKKRIYAQEFSGIVKAKFLHQNMKKLRYVVKRPKCSSYDTAYCCKCLVLFLFFSFRKAPDSICLILSLLTPISSPISCNVFILPSSIPNLHLMTCFSLGFRLSNTLSKSCFMNCLISTSSDVPASGCAITS